MTNYNIQTSGIVIGANIESHAFTLNKLGNSVETIVVDVDNLNKEISALAGEITQVSNELNTYIMTDVIFGFAEAGIGAISGIIASGSKGAFKMGEKTFAKAAEGGERGTVAIGEDFSRVSVEGELNVGKINLKTVKQQLILKEILQQVEKHHFHHSVHQKVVQLLQIQ